MSKKRSLKEAKIGDVVKAGQYEFTAEGDRIEVSEVQVATTVYSYSELSSTRAKLLAEVAKIDRVLALGRKKS